MYRMLYCWVFEVTGEDLKRKDPHPSEKTDAVNIENCISNERNHNESYDGEPRNQKKDTDRSGDDPGLRP